jgi:hypothetical protein
VASCPAKGWQCCPSRAHGALVLLDTMVVNADVETVVVAAQEQSREAHT